MKWHVFQIVNGDREHIGSRKTQAGAEALAERKAGKRIHGWFQRGMRGNYPILETLDGVWRLEFGW